MDASVAKPSVSTSVVSNSSSKKPTSAIVKIKKAIKRLGNTNFSKKLTDVVNSFVRTSWSLGRTAGRLCWVAGCYTVIILFPLAMEVDREQTLMEIQNRDKERMTKRIRS